MSRTDYDRGFDSAGGDLNSSEKRRGHAEWQRQQKELSERNSYKPPPEPTPFFSQPIGWPKPKPEPSGKFRTEPLIEVRPPEGPTRPVTALTIAGILVGGLYALQGHRLSDDAAIMSAILGGLAGACLGFALAGAAWAIRQLAGMTFALITFTFKFAAGCALVLCAYFLAKHVGM